jgi:membrane carboxypeptidase/penicillin-binding protein PbpC
MKTLFKQIFLLTILAASVLVFGSTAFGQTAKRIPFVKGKISTTIKGTGTQSYLVKITRGDMEFVVKIASKGKAAKGDITKNGRSVVQNGDDKTDLWETLGNGEYKLTVKAPKGTAFTMKLEVYKLEGQS